MAEFANGSLEQIKLQKETSAQKETLKLFKN